MKRLLPLLAVLLVLTSCSSREMTEPADTAEPERPETPQVQDTPVQTVAPSAVPVESASPAPAESEPVLVEPVPMPTPTPTVAPELAEGPTDEEILAAYQMAEEACGWFVLAPPELDRTEQRTVGELTYCRVDDPRFSNLAELRGYLKTLFSDTLVDQLLPIDDTQYVELDGVLYTIDGGRGADMTKGEETVQVLRDEAPARYTVRVTVEVLDPEQDYAVTGTEEHDFLYEQVGDQWIFTTFSAVR